MHPPVIDGVQLKHFFRKTFFKKIQNSKTQQDPFDIFLQYTVLINIEIS